ncbi:MAG: cysteine desulfurase family protein [Pseudomonadota bacterium]
MAAVVTYLDYNASAPMKPAVREAVAESLEWIGNPSSVHSFGRAVREKVEAARQRVADLVSVKPERVLFTSGATEANHLALQGAGPKRHFISAVEHDSIRKVMPEAEILPVDANGVLDLAALESALAKDPRPVLVSVMAANNETGVIEPITQAAKIVHAHGSYLLCDAVQTVGRVPVALAKLEADYLTLSGHKFGGPTGVGALVLGEGAPYTAPVAGGGQERGRRPGTENVPGIAGFAVAARLAAEDLAAYRNLTSLRDRLEEGVLAVAKEAKIFGKHAPRLANTSSVLMPGVASETQVMAFDLAGIAVSAGAACSSGKVEPSHVLLAMGASPKEAGATIRVSLGWATEAFHVERFVSEWKAIYTRSRARRVVAA